MVTNQTLLVIIIIFLVLIISVHFFNQKQENFYPCPEHPPCYEKIKQSCDPNKGEINAYCDNDDGKCSRVQCEAATKKWFIVYDYPQ